MSQETEQPEKGKNVRISGAIETTFTPEFLKDIKTGQEQEQTREGNRFLVEKVTLLVIIIYTALAFWQGCSNQKAANAAKNAADTEKAALIDVQRSFLYVTGIPIFPVTDIQKPDSISGFVSGVNIRNSGATPALDSVYHVNWVSLDKTIGKDFGFPDVDERGEAPNSEPIPGFWGPGSESKSTDIFIPISRAQDAQSRKKHLYIYGWIKYRDVFQAATDMPHRTLFCDEILFDASPIDNIKTLHAPRYATCPLHSCTDEQCAAQGYR
jgi:hypothetical protein